MKRISGGSPYKGKKVATGTDLDDSWVDTVAAEEYRIIGETDSSLDRHAWETMAPDEKREFIDRVLLVAREMEFSVMSRVTTSTARGVQPIALEVKDGRMETNRQSQHASICGSAGRGAHQYRAQKACTVRPKPRARVCILNVS